MWQKVVLGVHPHTTSIGTSVRRLYFGLEGEEIAIALNHLKLMRV